MIKGIFWAIFSIFAFSSLNKTLLDTNKLPVPARDTKRGRDGSGKNANGVWEQKFTFITTSDAI